MDWADIGSRTLYGCAHGVGATVTAGISSVLASMVALGGMTAYGTTTAFVIGSAITAFIMPLIVSIGITHYLGGDKTAILTGTLAGIAAVCTIPTIPMPFGPFIVVALTAVAVAMYKKSS